MAHKLATIKPRHKPRIRTERIRERILAEFAAVHRETVDSHPTSI